MSARSSSDRAAAGVLFAAGCLSFAVGLPLLAGVLVVAAFPFAVTSMGDEPGVARVKRAG